MSSDFFWVLVEDGPVRARRWCDALANVGVAGATEVSEAISEAENKRRQGFIFSEGFVTAIVPTFCSDKNQVLETVAGVSGSFLCCLDYVLDLADGETLSPVEVLKKISFGPRQLCLLTSSQIRDCVGPTRDAFAEEARRRGRFFRDSQVSLKSVEAAENLVKYACDFWKEANYVFTGDEAVDEVVGLYTYAFSRAWLDLEQAFHHDVVAKRESATAIEIQALFESRPGLRFPVDDEWKALFSCAVSRGEPTRLDNTTNKQVSKDRLQTCLEFLRFGENVDIQAQCWQPPFFPGILFLSQVKLLLNAFSDVKDKREPPRVVFYHNLVMFNFTTELGDGIEQWRNSSSGGNSCSLLRSLADGLVGQDAARFSEFGISELGASKVGKAISVCTDSRKVRISW